MRGPKRQVARCLAIVEAYRRLGTLKAAGREFGITRQAVHRVVKHYESETGERLPRGRHTRFSAEEIEDLIDCRRRGARWGDLAEAIGYPRRSVSATQFIIWRHLQRLNRLGEVPAIWGSSSRRWLERKYGAQ